MRAGALVVRVAGFMAAIFAFLRFAKGRYRSAEDQGAGEEQREINFHALQCGMRVENRRCFDDQTLMNGVARLQPKGSDLDVELFSARAYHLVGTPH